MKSKHLVLIVLCGMSTAHAGDEGRSCDNCHDLEQDAHRPPRGPRTNAFFSLSARDERIIRDHIERMRAHGVGTRTHPAGSASHLPPFMEALLNDLINQP
ncbi:MAG: hypothetical protein C0514_07435 [Candidatus Puniceispirillum sp.]|nr:hypothetical protein [Candidatus Puniceispirillum sp.]